MTKYLQSKQEDTIKTNEKYTNPLKEQIKELVHIQTTIKNLQNLLKEISYRIKSVDSNLYGKTKNIPGFSSLEYPRKNDTYHDCLQTVHELESLKSQVLLKLYDKKWQISLYIDESENQLDELYSYGCLVPIVLIFLFTVAKTIVIILFIVTGLSVFGSKLLISHLKNKKNLLINLETDLYCRVRL